MRCRSNAPWPCGVHRWVPMRMPVISSRWVEAVAAHLGPVEPSLHFGQGICFDVLVDLNDAYPPKAKSTPRADIEIL